MFSNLIYDDQFKTIFFYEIKSIKVEDHSTYTCRIRSKILKDDLIYYIKSGMPPLSLVNIKFRNTEIMMYNISVFFKNCWFHDVSIKANGNKFSHLSLINIKYMGTKAEIVVENCGKLLIKNCTFNDIKSGPEIPVISVEKVAHVYIGYCVFKNRNGSVISAKFATFIQVKHTVFANIHLSAELETVIFANFHLSTESETELSPFSVSSVNSVVISKTEFLKMSGKNGGALLLSNIKSFNIFNSSFVNNNAYDKGGSIFA